eukprot:7728460-Pyramimonas_sp.AAC.1
MPAFLATTHWEGIPRVTSLAYLASLYSGDGLVGITTITSWHGKLFSPDDACPHLKEGESEGESEGVRRGLGGGQEGNYLSSLDARERTRTSSMSRRL